MLTELIVAATALNGLLAGASLDQSIKQLPSRHRTGVSTYAAYTRGADLGSGIAWYAILANSAAILTVVAALVGWRTHVSHRLETLLLLGAASAIGHTLATLMAAPTMFSTRKVGLDDERTLAQLFDRFARWQALRAALQVLAFALTLWSMAVALHQLPARQPW